MSPIVPRLLAACGGFLLAVLWMDLMFDVQVLRHRRGDLPAEVVASIRGYYRRVTTEAFPMNRLIGVVMIGGIGALLVQLFAGREPLWLRLLAAVLVAVPVTLALARIFPDAISLGEDDLSVPQQSRLARRICYAHLFCLAAVTAFTAIEIAASW